MSPLTPYDFRLKHLKRSYCIYIINFTNVRTTQYKTQSQTQNQRVTKDLKPGVPLVCRVSKIYLKQNEVKRCW